MKKKQCRLYFIFVFFILFFCGTFFLNNINLIEQTNLPVTKNLNITSTQSNGDFSNAIIELINKYPTEDNALVFFDKEEDLTVDQDGNYLVNKQRFFSLTNTEMPTTYLHTNSLDDYLLEDVAENNNYKVTEGNFNMVLTKQFATKRLILETNNPNIDFCNAVAVVNFNDLYIMQYNTEEETRLAYEYYINHDDVININEDGFCWAESNQTETTIIPLGLTDNYSYSTWGAEEMGVPEYSQYLLDTINEANTKYPKLPEVVVAVLDSGIDTDHPWFADRFLVDSKGNYMGKNCTSESSETSYEFEDKNGHGTHCSGIICDMTLPNVKILPIKFMVSTSKGTSGTDTAAIAGVNYAIEVNKSHNVVAINMSFGKSGSGAFSSIITRAYSSGIFSVVSAGNDNDNASNYQPANVGKAITVSALDGKHKADYSNYGSVVDVCAPGTNILSASITGNRIYKSGTSMAAPHIAAYIALLYSDPSKNYNMTNIENILYGKHTGYQTVIDLGDSGQDDEFGYGLPVLNDLAVEYESGINIIIGNHGSASQSGLLLFTEVKDSLVLEFYPEENYLVYAVYFDGKVLPNSKKIDKYTFTNLAGRHEIRVEFAIEYFVYHYLEPIYDLSDDKTIPTYDKYQLISQDVLYGEGGNLTVAYANSYIGFTAMKFDQKTIGKDTIINIYYKRDIYTLKVVQHQNGILNIDGVGSYLYGENVAINLNLKNGYRLDKYEIDYCNDENFYSQFDFSALNQTFNMPASNLVFSVYSVKIKYLVTIDIVGDGYVTPSAESLYYGENLSFNIMPGIGIEGITIYFNGLNITTDELTYELPEVTSDVNLKVVFEQNEDVITESKVDENPKKNVLVWSGAGVGIIFVGVIIMIILFKICKSKRF